MGLDRKPFQGTWNIIKFNWHFYVIAGIACAIILSSTIWVSQEFNYLLYLMLLLILLPLTVSLLVSYYVYDFSSLYKLNWLDDTAIDSNGSVLNINAGFDETSEIIQKKFEQSSLHICDFYNPTTHTEVSIKRARKAYPPHPDTVKVDTKRLPYTNEYFDVICAIFAAHEVRDADERVLFFKELHRVLKPQGQLFVTEHLRDANNFWAYNIGFLHFYSRKSWLKTFEGAGMSVLREIKVTPFVRTFILKADGNTP